MKEIINTQEYSQKSYKDSEILDISNKDTHFNNKNNDKFNPIAISANENEYKAEDYLYGNNYINYNLKNKCSNLCFNSKIKKMGILPVFCFIKAKPIIVLGVKTTYLIVIYEIILHTSFIIIYYTILNFIRESMKDLLIIIYLTSFFCHLYIYLFNPGIPSIDHYYKRFIQSKNYMKMSENEKKNYYVCELCNIIVNHNENIEHCEDCQICVENYDHHCFWTGKCITKRNIWAFYGFAFGSMFYILWYFTIIFYYILLKFDEAKKKKK